MPDIEPLAGSHVRLDPRVLAAVDAKRPIGVSRPGWVNLLLERALASEPELLSRA